MQILWFMFFLKVFIIGFGHVSSQRQYLLWICLKWKKKKNIIKYFCLEKMHVSCITRCCANFASRLMKRTIRFSTSMNYLSQEISLTPLIDFSCGGKLICNVLSKKNPPCRLYNYFRILSNYQVNTNDSWTTDSDELYTVPILKTL